VFRKRLKRDVEQYTAKSSPHVKAAILKCQRTGDSSHGKKGATVEYVMTLSGAKSIDSPALNYDYDYYTEKQIKPIADPVLLLMKCNFDELNSPQMRLI
jgi:DNA polymerase-2